MARFFNTTGPCEEQLHYMLPPEARLPDLMPFVRQQQYFVVHAARQTGKSTAMIAFSRRLRGSGYTAVYVTFEQSQDFQEVSEAEPLWLTLLDRAARQQAPDVPTPDLEALKRWQNGDRLREWLTRWCVASPNPVVLVLDEVDIIKGPALINLLRQLRAGFLERSQGRFPSAIGLVGMRDLRDYLTHARDGVRTNPGSPFNIKSASLTIRDFTEDELNTLYDQHTADTGQIFTPEARARAFWWTQGQPYLTNALASIATTELVTDRSQPLTAGHIDAAKERLVLARTTHLDSLAERLKEDRVARIVQPVLLGDTPFSVPYEHDDFQYTLDLGLLRRGDDGAEPANPLYREVLARQLSYRMQMAISAPRWRWLTEEGRLDFPALVHAFLQWWRENEQAITAHGNKQYPEALPHLAFMAFLQRIVNGGGTVMREYAAGRGAVDVVVTYGPDRFVVELKRAFAGGKSLDRVREEGAQQLAGYLDTLGEPEGWLIVFDQRPGKTWGERLWVEDRTAGGRTLLLRGA